MVVAYLFEQSEMKPFLLYLFLLPLASMAQDEKPFGLWSVSKEIVDKESGDLVVKTPGAHLFQVDQANNLVIYTGPSDVKVPLRIWSTGQAFNTTTWVFADGYFDKLVLTKTPGSELYLAELYFKSGRTFYRFRDTKQTW